MPHTETTSGFKVIVGDEISRDVQVSVCIPHYRGKDILLRCLESVIEQDFDGSKEILIHDDAGNDLPLEEIRARYPQASILISEKNVGFCVANNRMVKLARGYYVLLLNNDAYLSPKALSALFNAAEENGPRILSLPQYSAEGLLVDYGNKLDLFFCPVPINKKNTTNVGMVHGACLWVRKCDWDIFGGFPNFFGSIAEDVYICCVARLLGIDVQVVDSSAYNHVQGHSFGGSKPTGGKLRTNVNRRMLSERNRAFTLTITTPGPIVFIAVPFHLSCVFIEALALTVFTRNPKLVWKIYAHAMIAVWSNRELLMTYRNRIQSQRSITSFRFYQAFTLVPQKLRMFLRFGMPEVR